MVYSSRSIDLRREKKSVTNHSPPDDLHLLCKYIVFSALGRMVALTAGHVSMRQTQLRREIPPFRPTLGPHVTQDTSTGRVDPRMIFQQHVPGCRGWRIGWPQMPERLTTTAPCRRRRRKERSRTRTHHVRPQARLVLCQLASHTLRTTTCEWIVQSTVLSSAHELSDRQGRPSVEWEHTRR